MLSIKKPVLILTVLVSIVLAVAVIRAFVVFSDNQVQVENLTTDFTPDKNAAIERLSKAVQFKTISSEEHASNQSDFQQFVDFLALNYPVLWEQYPPERISDYSLLFRIKSSNATNKPILFLAHTDVVPVDEETMAKWQHAPFSGAIEDGKIWGRGTIDDKSSVMALLEVAEYLIANQQLPDRDIYLAFGHDEEIGGKQGAAKIADQLKSEDLNFEFILDEGGVITQGIMPGISQPLALIGVAEKGFANFKLTVEGKGGHSSQPPTHTAAGIIAKAVVKIEQNPFPADLTFMNKTFRKIGAYADVSMRLPFSNLWLLQPVIESAMNAKPATSASIRTTAAVTMLKGSSKSNILPTEASAVVNFRLFPGTSIANVEQHLKKVIDDDRVKLEPFMATEASTVSPDNSASFKLLERTIRGIDDNILVAPYLVIAGTDAKHYEGLSENIYRFMMVQFTPESLQRMHGINEHIDIVEYHRVMEFYYQLISKAND